MEDKNKSYIDLDKTKKKKDSDEIPKEKFGYGIGEPYGREDYSKREIEDYPSMRGEYFIGGNYKERKFINLSDKPLNANINKKGLKRLILLPDHSPGRGKLPVGSVAVYSKEEHIPTSEYLGPDIGCGILLAKFKHPLINLKYSNYKLASRLRASKKELGSLGGGNHFIDFYEVSNSKSPLFKKRDQLVLIHSGSRLKGKEIFEKGLKGLEYLEKYKEVNRFGKENRKELLKLVEECVEDKTDIILDNIHNSLEVNDDFIYRKGTVKLKDDELGIISSSMGENAILITPKPSLKQLEFSVCHGTGRKISRGEAKEIYFDSEEIRKKICIPSIIYDENLKNEAPFCYRSLEEIFPRIKEFVLVKGILKSLSHVCS